MRHRPADVAIRRIGFKPDRLGKGLDRLLVPEAHQVIDGPAVR
jgi:hypothetical protein